MTHALLQLPRAGQKHEYHAKTVDLCTARGITDASKTSTPCAMRHRHDLPKISRTAQAELLEGMIRYEYNEIQKLQQGLRASKAAVSGGQAVIVLKDIARLAGGAAAGTTALVEHTGGFLFASHVHRHPLLRSFLDTHLPHSTVATKQAIENALYNSALKSGLLVGSLIVAPEAALAGILLHQLYGAVLEYALVVRPKQAAQNTVHLIHSRRGRLACYRRLRSTITSNGGLSAEQLHRILKRRNKQLPSSR